ncbi:DUF1405 domain-containing protein [Metabacillus sediminilitoris]|uniref:DUF1405 domain-containing protein n=1 Tax=Metabacillus sediminilitoris TaxID=2567941 RepID=A0A4S4C5F1_9BACI|nr:DUF1405 domain-containing protein [Metabacillus sediminilitoris]QGQ46674.1 DUF1405 domain-containing protein [Metabacillus sediminilitoris]THF82824.1 DUF1405 domain-containing protein [Metabacillus sediminilitoris]
MKIFQYALGQKPFLIILTLINFFGTAYGYYWYRYQLADTPAHFYIFVPDSPTASLFFFIVLVGFLMHKNFPIIEALAIVTLFKYGIWAVIMNILVLMINGSLPWESYMLIASHFGMAIQGLLYAPYYRFKVWHLLLAAVWTFHNDVIDYVFGMMPRYSVIMDYINQVGYFTFWLSVISLLIAYYLVIDKRAKQLSLPKSR